jgi:hypothetical protein
MDRMKPTTKRVVRVVLLCAALGCIAARFWLRHRGQDVASDTVLLVGFGFMVALGFVRPENHRKRK